ncbi:hypothetical protein [Kitasatospora cathayae]|uniref:Integral membrane protein n=1 Tax=Kitasatospora cathayae TaxID=3004092 RepID=A0ABY7PW43_9ACTN|nr:hypothetical protein [Kitasatospora sp. HUAS 3-15]WBP84668.1 hypothetical protein O1G21_01580 [Kitasatospora sp. HUAS 3-15]
MSTPIAFIRALVCAFLLDTLAQAALAGLFVTGDVDLLAWHDANAQLLAALAAALVGAAVLLRVRGGGPGWPIAATGALLVLVLGQQGLGQARILAGHIPLALGIFGTATALTCWSFTYHPVPGEAS